MIGEIRIEGYRSIRDLCVDLAPLTVVLGGNGTGKTNLYRALELIRGAAAGDLAQALAAEGGMNSALWAGAPWRNEDERQTGARPLRRKGDPIRLTLSAEIEHLTYRLVIGVPGATEAALAMDPVVREETVTARAGRRKVVMMKREGSGLSLRDPEGKLSARQHDLLLAETALASLGNMSGAPEAFLLQRQIAAWRFYHQFRSDPASPLRRPQVPVTAPSLDSDGANWGSVLLTRSALAGENPEADAALEDAFPGSELDFAPSGTAILPQLHMPGFQRPFTAGELSDGTLRFLCLTAALTALRPAPFMALNEPETSLHESLIGPLARLIGAAADRSQILVVTHSSALAETLDLDFGASLFRLHNDRGETRIA